MINKNTKPDLLLLHGALGSQVEFDAVLPYLTEAFQIYTFNFSGHGGTKFNVDFSIPQFAEETRAFIHKNKLHKPSIFGYSMGGYVALYMAAFDTEIAGSIATLGTKFNWTPDTVIKESGKLNPQAIEEKVPKFARVLAELHKPNDWKTLLTKTADMMRDISENYYLSPQVVGRIRVPVRIGLGSEDKMVSLEESKRMVDMLPNGTLELLENVEHPIIKIQPRVLHRYIYQNLF